MAIARSIPTLGERLGRVSRATVMVGVVLDRACWIATTPARCGYCSSAVSRCR
jgi:hypothetical protein